MTRFLPILLAFSLRGCTLCPTAEQGAKYAQVNFERLADSIRVEEGNNPRWLYGVHHASRKPLGEPEARKRCLSICKRNHVLWASGDAKTGFVAFLATHYCPANAKSWQKNVEWLYFNRAVPRENRRYCAASAHPKS